MSFRNPITIALLAVGLASCGVADEIPNLTEELIDESTDGSRPERFALIVVAPPSLDCAEARDRVVLRLARDLIRTGHELAVVRADTTGIGSPLLDLGVDQRVTAENPVSGNAARTEVGDQVEEVLAAELCSGPPPVAAGLDVVELVESGAHRAVELAAGRPARLYVLTTGVHVTPTVDIRDVAPPDPVLAAPVTEAGGPLETVLVGPGDFSRVAADVDPVFAARTLAFARQICAALGECAVLPTLDVSPEVPS